MYHRGHLRPQDLESFAKQAFGTGYRPVKTERLYGGAQKVIYKVDFANGFACLLYVWDLSQNYFQEEIEDADAPSWNSYGANLFAANQAFLKQNGIRTAALYAMNRERTQYPFDYAFVEFIAGPKLEAYLDDASPRSEPLMEQLSDLLRRMHGLRRETYGPVDGCEDQLIPCHRYQLMNALRQLDYAAQHVASVAAHREQLIQRMHDLEQQIKPRQNYGLVHGELGPDHLLVKNDAELCLIDIEGASFYDVEHEHGFLRLRFGSWYRHLQDDALDADRLAFYQLHHYISCTSGGLKLLQRGFRDEALARKIFEHNLRSALAFIGRS
ncbi:phosphotransferase family protein [Paenibacillus sacheonensis]|uniref:Phosphotransferase n=1 Tax=Paenibacillus sacheonensis TaxID=742054 RepID=A0A7X4YMQ7_9BACL|nr:aminoglycoside phosphotransferase family protein [Paenibacillus sacheonensis]MBM7563162.1 hypothetical protein [Paenibacillus sacheonensis]NBC68274.1 phosphotransferase [Paenibacillus sacheonensis]